MNMEVRKLNKSEFYPTFVEWSNLHGFPLAAGHLLPETALVCSNEGIDIYGIWFYETDSLLAYLAYPISNREVAKELKIGGLEFLLNEVEKYAKEIGFSAILTTSGTEKVIEVLTNCGYNIGDTNIQQMIKNI